MFGSHLSNLPLDWLVKNVAICVMVIPQNHPAPIHEPEFGFGQNFFEFFMVSTLLVCV